MKLLHAVFCLIVMLGLSNAMIDESFCTRTCIPEPPPPHNPCIPGMMSPERLAECQLLHDPYKRCVIRCKEQVQDPEWLAQHARNTMIMEHLSRGNLRGR